MSTVITTNPDNERYILAVEERLQNESKKSKSQKIGSWVVVFVTILLYLFLTGVGFKKRKKKGVD